MYSKKFYESCPWCQFYKTSGGIIYTPYQQISYDFDWGYADNGVITSKKLDNLCYMSI